MTWTEFATTTETRILDTTRPPYKRRMRNGIISMTQMLRKCRFPKMKSWEIRHIVYFIEKDRANEIDKNTFFIFYILIFERQRE